MLRLRDPSLSLLGTSCIDSGLQQHAAGLMSIAARRRDGDYEWPTHRDDTEWAAWDWLLGVTTKHAEGVYSFPLLTPRYTEALADQFYHWCDEGAAEVNEEEDAPYQMHEIVLNHECPLLFAPLAAVRVAWIDTLSLVLLGLEAPRISTIQFARYDNTISQGNWHTDASSDITATVSLDPDAFEGGGTDVWLPGGDIVEVPPLPAGHCLLFKGSTTPHRGRAVTEGERDLIVFWSAFED